jgi:hypothetical protein
LDSSSKIGKNWSDFVCVSPRAGKSTKILGVSSASVCSSSSNLPRKPDLEQSNNLSEPTAARIVPFPRTSLYNTIHSHQHIYQKQGCLLSRPSCATPHAMARLHLTALLSPNKEEQLSALQTLKNEIVGHDQKKEKWVENGVIEPVVKILESSRSSHSTSGKDNSRGRVLTSRPLTSEENVRLQALHILASLANGTTTLLLMPRTLWSRS